MILEAVSYPACVRPMVNLKAVLDAMIVETFMHLPHINAGILPSPYIQGNCTVSLEIADVLVNKRHPYIRWYTLYGGHPLGKRTQSCRSMIKAIKTS